MKRTSKILAAVLVIAMVFALAIPALAAPAGFAAADSIVKIDKKGYDSFIGKEYTSNNSSWNLGDGVKLVSDNKTKNAECWYFDVAEGAKGTIEVAYKISNNYFVASFIFDGAGKFYIGDAKGSNGVNMVKAGPYDDGNIATDPEEDEEEPVIINLGFIGYYVYDSKVMSTSIHWQNLEKEGDMIDWGAVDAAYADWMAQGGLAPDRSVWQTSGYASFTFEDYKALGFGDFNIGQLENYYKAFYVDPGYILPVEPIIVDLGFIGHYLFEGEVLTDCIHWQRLGEGDFIDWDAVNAAYDAWVARGGLEPDRTVWQTSGAASFNFADYAAIGHSDFSLDQIEGFYRAYYVSPGYFLTVVVDE